MRKSKLVAIVVACALLLGLASCSSPSSSSSSSSNCGNGGGQQELKLNNKTHFVSGETLTFNITQDSTDSENTFVVFEYFRSVVGAKEKIQLTNVDFEVTVNGNPVDTSDFFAVDFVLHEYGSSFSATAEKPIANTDDIKQYQSKIKIPYKLSAGEKITIKLKEANVRGEGWSAVDLANITTVIVDCAESAGWWKELTAKNEQYVKGLITEINEHENDPEFNTFVKEENRSKLLAFYVSDKTITSETTTSEGSHKNLGKIFVTFYNDNTMDIGIAEPKDDGGYNISGFEGKPYEGDPKAEKGLD